MACVLVYQTECDIECDTVNVTPEDHVIICLRTQQATEGTENPIACKLTKCYPTSTATGSKQEMLQIYRIHNWTGLWQSGLHRLTSLEGHMCR